MPGPPVAVGGEVPESDLVPIGGEVPESALEGAPDTKQDDSALGAVGRGLSSFWEQINPIAAVKATGEAIQHPLATAESLGHAQGKLYYDAKAAFEKGDYITGARKAVNYLLPLIGPALDAQSEKGAAGDVAGMVGGSLGLGTAMVAPELASKGLPQIPGVANRLQKAAESKFVKAISPETGPQKARFGAMAAKSAPQALAAEDLGAMSRQGLQMKVASKLEEAEAGLDAARQARNPNLVWHTKPILKALQEKLDRITSQTVRSGATKAGEDVIPQPNMAHAKQIQQAMQEIETLGPVVKYESLRRIREAYDKVAKTKYAPLATDPLTAASAKASANGAADVTGVLRDKLAQFDPPTAEANAPYSLYKNLHDVLQATEEAERVRPSRGRQIAGRLAASVAGESVAGVPGALIGWLTGPMIDEALNAGMTTKIASARVMADLADAMRTGKQAKIQPLLYRLASMTRTTPALRAALEAPQMVPVAADSSTPSER